MNNIKRIFSIPKDFDKFKSTMKSIEGCEIIDSRAFENIEGPEIEEIYKCPCGNIDLKQKSIIGDIDNPEKGSIEIIHMESKGCVL